MKKREASRNPGCSLGDKAKLLFVMTIFLACVLCGCAPEPQVPISVTFRKSWVGEGLVAVLKNETSSHIKILVKLSNATTKQNRECAVVLGPLGSKEIGWLQGWTCVPGESLTIQLDGYATKHVRVP